MKSLTVLPVACLQDNYAYLLHDAKTEQTAVIDPAEAAPVLETLEARGWSLHSILNTHHHYDHVGGNLALKEKTGATVIGHAGDAHRIPGIDTKVQEAGSFTVGGVHGKVLAAAGHTQGHVLYWFESEELLFTGDTLF